MYRIYSDGGARGNPGPAACAVVVTENGRIVWEGSEFLGEQTNNRAEYRGLIAAVNKALELKAGEVEFVMDSELVVKQMRGEYRVRSPAIKDLHEDAVALSSLIPSVGFRHVRREDPFITRADALLNIELDSQR
ncbi:MAG: ribonuclease HI family protein [Candidatus Methanomethylophilaceae archaeon]|jgi:ribonuclease HI|nr:ribonuclease HI family protein [Candidatus Methanomethylophilaceae archaeon]NLF33785.1 ribonuclease HI family protein [Thermoplasmatales archaeon]